MHRFYNDILANTIARHAGKAALVHEGAYVSFQELDTLADAIGHGLRQDGVGRGEIVPVVLGRGIAAVAAVLGVWRAGAAVAVLDPDDARRRLDLMIRECSASIVLDRDWLRSHRLTDGPTPAGPEAIPTPDDPAFVVFVSGSAGHPKGVVIPHRTLAGAVRSHGLGRTGEDVFLSLSPLSMVNMEVEVLTPLALGGTVHLSPGSSSPRPEDIAHYVREHAITAAVMAPEFAESFLDRADGVCRSILLGMDRARGIFSVLTRVLNCYGSAETCGPVTSFEIDMPYDEVPLGRALEGSRIQVLDDDLRLVGPGDIGEICVSGHIASGYLNNPVVTARRFVVNPHSRDGDSAVLFRTGDRGRVRPDGVVEYCGRNDRMVKVAGRRVEPGEVEVAMLETSPLDGAVVAMCQLPDGRMGLCGWYTAGRPLPVPAVEAALQRALPAYMVPAVLRQVDAFPKTETGSIDINRLQQGES